MFSASSQSLSNSLFLAGARSSLLSFVVGPATKCPASVFQLRDFRQRDGGGPPSAPVGHSPQKSSSLRAHNGPRWPRSLWGAFFRRGTESRDDAEERESESRGTSLLPPRMVSLVSAYERNFSPGPTMSLYVARVKRNWLVPAVYPGSRRRSCRDPIGMSRRQIEELHGTRTEVATTTECHGTRRRRV